MTCSLLSVAVAAAFVASPVLAEKVSMTVSYRDLDLTHAEGVAALRHRVANAVTAVCGEADTANLRSEEGVRACRRHAVAGADAQIALAVSEARQLAAAAPSGVLISSR
jgi:UrcA family protein